jgi:hypothetical protein
MVHAARNGVGKLRQQGAAGFEHAGFRLAHGRHPDGRREMRVVSVARDDMPVQVRHDIAQTGDVDFRRRHRFAHGQFDLVQGFVEEQAVFLRQVVHLAHVIAPDHAAKARIAGVVDQDHSKILARVHRRRNELAQLPVLMIVKPAPARSRRCWRARRNRAASSRPADVSQFRPRCGQVQRRKPIIAVCRRRPRMLHCSPLLTSYRSDARDYTAYVAASQRRRDK